MEKGQPTTRGRPFLRRRAAGSLFDLLDALDELRERGRVLLYLAGDADREDDDRLLRLKQVGAEDDVVAVHLPGAAEGRVRHAVVRALLRLAVELDVLDHLAQLFADRLAGGLEVVLLRDPEGDADAAVGGRRRELFAVGLGLPARGEDEGDAAGFVRERLGGGLRPGGARGAR